jgi:hypothetical protein
VEEPPVIVNPTTSAAESPAKPADDSTSVVGTSGAAETSAMAIDETKLMPGGSGTKVEFIVLLPRRYIYLIRGQSVIVESLHAMRAHSWRDLDMSTQFSNNAFLPPSFFFD